MTVKEGPILGEESFLFHFCFWDPSTANTPLSSYAGAKKTQNTSSQKKNREGGVTAPP